MKSPVKAPTDCIYDSFSIDPQRLFELNFRDPMWVSKAEKQPLFQNVAFTGLNLLGVLPVHYGTETFKLFMNLLLLSITVRSKMTCLEAQWIVWKMKNWDQKSFPLGLILDCTSFLIEYTWIKSSLILVLTTSTYVSFANSKSWQEKDRAFIVVTHTI